jgi:hypothetical protein
VHRPALERLGFITRFALQSARPYTPTLSGVVCSGADAHKPAFLLLEKPAKRPKQLDYGSGIFTGENLLQAGITMPILNLLCECNFT